MSLQALSVTQTSRLTRSGRSSCRQAANLIVAAQAEIMRVKLKGEPTLTEVGRRLLDPIRNARVPGAFVNLFGRRIGAGDDASSFTNGLAEGSPTPRSG